MGLALANVAHSMGANVELISTFKTNQPYKTTFVESADDMYKEVNNSLKNADCVIMAAAVADYKIENYSEQKMKKTSEDKIILTMVKNPDILKEISNKNTKAKIVGFCAESENLIDNAKIKISNKGCDYLVANDISRKDIGFSSDENEIYILDKDLNIKHFKKDTKQNIAKNILEYIFE